MSWEKVIPSSAIPRDGGEGGSGGAGLPLSILYRQHKWLTVHFLWVKWWS